MRKIVLFSLLLLFSAALVVSGQVVFSWNQYKSDLVRCADAAGTPCGTTITGSDPLSSGKVIIDTNGSVQVKIKGAVPQKTYNIYWGKINGGTTGADPASVSFTLIGSVATNVKGTATGNFPNVLSGISAGFVIFADGALNQFISGIAP